MKKTYLVVQKPSFSEFQSEVNKYIRNGYKMEGLTQMYGRNISQLMVLKDEL